MSVASSISQLKNKKILVAGDLMLDTYTIGKAKRISPEAPVPIIQVIESDERPGGAGNAILNLVSLGASVTALGRVGDDHAGKTLLEKLLIEEVDLKGIVIDKSYQTPIKNRVIADHQQVVRIDHEMFNTISEQDSKTLIEKIPSLLEGIEVVAISDYGKGFLSDQILKTLIEESTKRNIFVIVDPKGNNFKKYKNATLIKPNLSEAINAAKATDKTPLEEVAGPILDVTNAQYLMITRSENGITLFNKHFERKDFPVKVKDVRDVTGAGDTVLAVLAFGIANNLPIDKAIDLSNLAASLAIEVLGCARVTLPQIARRALQREFSNTTLNATHFETLQIALKDTPSKIYSIMSEDELTLSLLKDMAEHKSRSSDAIIIQIANGELKEETLSLLSAFKCVDHIYSTPSE